MGSKRDHTALSYSDGDDTPPQSSSKRQRNQNQASRQTKQQEPKTDLTYGQRCVFPGLNAGTTPADEELDFEDETDALAYLRSVRVEASAIPHLLVAPKAGPQLPAHLHQSEGIDRSVYQDGLGDSRGYYFDGAYTAAPDATYSEDEGEYHEDDDSASQDARKADDSADSKVRDAYFACLTAQFAALRAQLHQDPPAEILQALPPNHETEVGFFGAKSSTFKQWTHRLRYTDPLPAQIAAMDRQSVLRLLRIILGGKFLRRGFELRERTSRWIWSLLARLPDRGGLDHIEVGWVRELGKRAVLMMVSITQMAALRAEVEGDIDGERLGDDSDDGDDDLDDEFLDDMEPDIEDGGGWVDNAATGEDGSNSDDVQAENSKPPMSNSDKGDPLPLKEENDDYSDGEADMDLDMEDGEVPDQSTESSGDNDADIAAVKARLLSQLEDVQPHGEPTVGSDPALVDKKSNTGPYDNGEDAYDETHARINMRATLNMILTVAGEFYGQRDLLEFRDPFASL